MSDERRVEFKHSTDDGHRRVVIITDDKIIFEEDYKINVTRVAGPPVYLDCHDSFIVEYDAECDQISLEGNREHYMIKEEVELLANWLEGIKTKMKGRYNAGGG